MKNHKCSCDNSKHMVLWTYNRTYNFMVFILLLEKVKQEYCFTFDSETFD